MAGGIGATVTAGARPTSPCHAFLFGEDQARYVIAVRRRPAPDLLYEAAAAGVPARHDRHDRRRFD